MGEIKGGTRKTTNCACCARITAYSIGRGRTKATKNSKPTSATYSNSRAKAKGGAAKKKKGAKEDGCTSENWQHRTNSQGETNT